MLGLVVKRSAASSSEESPEESGVTARVVGKAAEVAGGEDVAGSATTLVDSVKGADVMRTESDGEGRTSVGRSSSDYCWHFLTQSLGMVSSQQQRQETPGRPPHSGDTMGRRAVCLNDYRRIHKRTDIPL